MPVVYGAAGLNNSRATGTRSADITGKEQAMASAKKRIDKAIESFINASASNVGSIGCRFNGELG
jgi:hypothetical protein